MPNEFSETVEKIVENYMSRLKKRLGIPGRRPG
jgi:hypothetical protein